MTFMSAICLLVAWLAVALAARDRHRLDRLRGDLDAAHHAATHDALTWLPNRTGLAKAWPMLAPAGPAVAVLDLDGFKPVNDTHGHAAGDAVLIAVADRLRDVVHGVAARLGGDEFALVLLDQDPTAAVERLAQVIARPITIAGGHRITVTASIGLVRRAGDDLATALADADSAMYRAKVSGAHITTHDPHRDDRQSPAADPRPAHRLRDYSHAVRPEVSR